MAGHHKATSNSTQKWSQYGRFFPRNEGINDTLGRINEYLLL